MEAKLYQSKADVPKQPANLKRLSGRKFFLFIIALAVAWPTITTARSVLNPADKQVESIWSGWNYSDDLLDHNIDDQAMVLQKCIDLPELLTYFPKNDDNSYKRLYVMQYPVSFPLDIAVSKFGENIGLLSRPEIQDNKIEAFFLFKSFSIIENTANVTFDYYYNHTTTPKLIEVTLDLEKVGTEWSITNSTFNHR